MLQLIQPPGGLPVKTPSGILRQREIRDRAQRECWPEITVDNFVEVRRGSLDNDAKERRKALKLIHGGKAYASGATLLAQLASCQKR